MTLIKKDTQAQLLPASSYQNSQEQLHSLKSLCLQMYLKHIHIFSSQGTLWYLRHLTSTSSPTQQVISVISFTSPVIGGVILAGVNPRGIN